MSSHKLLSVARIFFIMLPFIPKWLFGQSMQEVNKKMGPNPIVVINGVIVPNALDTLKPINYVLLTVLSDTDATNAYGDTAKDGAIILKTKAFAKSQYISFFRRVSAKYDSLYSMTNTDTLFQYIANDKLVKGQNHEGLLSVIDEKIFISIEILSADDLKKKYNISDKQYGILIHCLIPQNFSHAEEKF
jgi:hypothetical protein